MAWLIAGDALPSAIYGGFAIPEYVEQFKATWKNAVLSLDNMRKNFLSFMNRAKNKIEEGFKFFKDWLEDDPVGAVAGAGAALLSTGVILIVGGTAVGSVIAGGGATATAGAATGGGGLLSTIIGWGKTALTTALGAITLGGLIRMAVQGTQYLWRFNWNQTDTQIREQQVGLINSLYGQLGTALGSTAGTLLCGSAPIELLKRTNLVKLNPLVFARLKEITEFNPTDDSYGELYEEMMQNVRALVNSGIRVGSQIAFMEIYKNVRSWIKLGSKAVGLEKVFPGLADLISKWGEDGSKSWSFASAIEEWIEDIDDKRLQAFTEEFYESFTESCTESAMIISYVF